MRCCDDGMTRFEPELWVDHPSKAVEFYALAFGARVLHQVGKGDDMVAQLAVGDAAFWVSSEDPGMGRLGPTTAHGATGRTLLVCEDPARVFRCVVEAGATEKSPVRHQHGWLLGHVVDPFGHEWEIGIPIGAWPPEDESPVVR